VWAQERDAASECVGWCQALCCLEMVWVCTVSCVCVCTVCTAVCVCGGDMWEASDEMVLGRQAAKQAAGLSRQSRWVLHEYQLNSIAAVMIINLTVSS
jgi:hypothetical protein